MTKREESMRVAILLLIVIVLCVIIDPERNGAAGLAAIVITCLTCISIPAYLIYRVVKWIASIGNSYKEEKQARAEYYRKLAEEKKNKTNDLNFKTQLSLIEDTDKINSIEKNGLYDEL